MISFMEIQKWTTANDTGWQMIDRRRGKHMCLAKWQDAALQQRVERLIVENIVPLLDGAVSEIKLFTEYDRGNVLF